MSTHDIIPEPADGELFYQVKAKDQQAKPCRWTGYVLASSASEAEAIIEEHFGELSLGLLGLKWVKMVGGVHPADIEDRLRMSLHPNALVYVEDGEAHRIHRGMLDGTEA